MTVPYILRKNHLTAREDDYSAKPVVFESINQEELVKRVATKHSSLNETDILLAVKAYETEINEELIAGHNIITPMCNISLSISGVFDREVTEFDPEIHKLKLNYRPGVDFKNTTDQIHLVKITAAEVVPEIELFEDAESKTQNDKVTPGKAGTIKGDKLKINTEDAEEGIFFVGEDESSFKVVNFLRNKPAEIIFMIPDTLIAGNYHLQVRSKMDGKSLRISELDFELTVD